MSSLNGRSKEEGIGELVPATCCQHLTSLTLGGQEQSLRTSHSRSKRVRAVESRDSLYDETRAERRNTGQRAVKAAREQF
jgi:hypothetical protein